MKALEAEVDDYAERFVRKLRPEGLEGSFQFTPGKGGGVVTVAVRKMLWHMVEEELQHRGELNALLWQMDVDAPVFDWIGWTELRNSQKA